MKPLEHLSKFNRKATPLPMCKYLVDRVRKMFKVETVAVLWVERKTHYWQLWPLVELWGLGRDARTYNGPHPIIAHPPCGPWGKHKAKCFHAREDGIIAMDLVHRWGGVVEQPLGSQLFKEHGREGATIEKMDQSDYGHVATKTTLLYWALIDQA